MFYYELMFIHDQEVPRTGMSNLDIDNDVESEVPMSPSASSVALDGTEDYTDLTPLETLSQTQNMCWPAPKERIKRSENTCKKTNDSSDGRG